MSCEDYFGNMRKSAEEELFSIIENSLYPHKRNDVLFVYVTNIKRNIADEIVVRRFGCDSMMSKIFKSFDPATADIFVSASGRFDNYLDYTKFESIQAPITIAYCSATQDTQFPINMGDIRDTKILMSM